jgi:hypothetical protein
MQEERVASEAERMRGLVLAEEEAERVAALEAARVAVNNEAGFDEGILSLCRPISLLYGESL